MYASQGMAMSVTHSHAFILWYTLVTLDALDTFDMLDMLDTLDTTVLPRSYVNTISKLLLTAVKSE